MGGPTLPLTPKKGGSDGPPSSTRGKKKKKADAGSGGSPLAPIAEGSKPSSALMLCAISPLMEAAGSKGLQLRAEFDLTSDKAGELPSGSTVHVVELVRALGGIYGVRAKFQPIDETGVNHGIESGNH